MPLPDFTDDEQYLINCVKSPKASAASSSHVWGYLLGGAALAGFAAFHESIPGMLAAFVIVYWFRINEERGQTKWTPLWRSIIAKYEASSTSNSGATEPDGKPSS